MTQRNLPLLKINDWEPSRLILQGYTQVLGKVRTALTPPQKYKEQSTLQTTATGLSTTPMSIGSDTAEMRLDFFGNMLILTTSRGEIWQKPLSNVSPAELYKETVEIFTEFDVTLDPSDQFSKTKPENYDADMVESYWKILSQIDMIFKQVRGEIRTETTSVAFFPERFELAFHCLSGRLISGAHAHEPEESDERLTFSFSTGDADVTESYLCVTATPQPAGFLDIALPPGAEWNSRGFQGIVMMYDTFRQAIDPKEQLLTFLREIQQKTLALMK